MIDLLYIRSGECERKIGRINTFVKANMKNSLPALETLFAALSDGTRLRLLNLMAEGEVCVCFFVEVLDTPQPTISRHLAYLRKAGLVADRREGKWIHYRITAPEEDSARKAFAGILETLRDDPGMQRERRALAAACCSPRAPEILRRAPKPIPV
jgi:ArsR family transcriptional regulator